MRETLNKSFKVEPSRLDRDFVRITDPKNMYPAGSLEQEAWRKLFMIRGIAVALVVVIGTLVGKEMHRRLVKKGYLI